MHKDIRNPRVGKAAGHLNGFRRLSYLAVALLVCANVGISIYAGITYWWRVPYADMIETLNDYFHHSWWHFLFKPENEHVLIVGKLFYELDFHLFRATGGFLILASWTFIAASAWAIASAASQSAEPERRHALFWNFLGLSLVLFLWMVNADNLLWPHQVILYSSVCFFLLSARIFARWPEYPPSLMEAAIAIGLMCLSVFSFGFGVAGAATMLVALLIQRSPWRLALAAGSCLGLSVAACFWLVHVFHTLGTDPGWSDPLQSARQLHAVVAFLVVYFSAPAQAMLDPVMDADTARIFSELASIAGLFAGGLILVLACRRGIASPASGFALSLVTFGLAGGLITALARLGQGPEYALSSRYFVIPAVFWIGLALFAVTRPQLRPEQSGIAILGVALLALSLVTAWQVRWLKQQTGTPLGETEMALVDGVYTPNYLTATWGGPQAWTQAVMEELRQRDWSIFHQPIARMIGKSGIEIFGAPATGCVGDINYNEPVTGMPQAARIYGWAYDMQTRSHIRDIVFLEPDGVIRGIGRTISKRDDVLKGRPDISDPLTGWLGFYRAGDVPANQIDAYAVVRRGGHPALCKIEG